MAQTIEAIQDELLREIRLRRLLHQVVQDSPLALLGSPSRGERTKAHKSHGLHQHRTVVLAHQGVLRFALEWESELDSEHPEARARPRSAAPRVEAGLSRKFA